MGPLIDVVGLGVAPEHLTPPLMEIISSSEVVAGGRRHLERFASPGQERLVISGDIQGLLSKIAEAVDAGRRVAVLATGDPMFYGIGTRIVERFGRAAVRVHPNVSVAQYAFAKAGLCLDRAEVISLHGRKAPEAARAAIMGALSRSGTVGIFTDTMHTPQAVAEILTGLGLGDSAMIVCQRLGTDEERLEESAASECIGPFLQPNFLIVRLASGSPIGIMPVLGRCEEKFSSVGGMITKAEARAVILAKLRLEPGLRMWDIGAGSGSVSIEAASLLFPGEVLAIERSREAFSRLESNVKASGFPNIQPIMGLAQECMAGLPLPQRVFVGGGGSSVAEILRFCVSLEPPPGVIVVSAVRLETLMDSIQVFRDCGWPHKVVHLQVSRGREVGSGLMLSPLNPVWLISAEPRYG